MTGQQSSACDIWSVGCTVLELLTGKPPYFDLQQMPALFRIVQDEHPPLPDGISASLKDFLLSCFAKDPNRRIDAAGLLKHPWLKKAVEKERAKEGRVRGLSAAIDEKKTSSIDQRGGAVEGLEKPEEEIKAPSPPHPPLPRGGDDEEEDWDLDDEDPEVQQRNPLAIKPRAAVVDDGDDIFAEFSDDDSHPLPQPDAALPSASSVSMPVSSIVDPSLTSMMIAADTNGAKRLDQFIEDERVEEDEFADMMDGDVGELQLATKATLLQAPAKPDSAQAGDEDEDPFDDIDFTDTTASEEELALNKSFTRIIQLLSPDQSEDVVIEQCERLMSLYRAHPQRVIALMNGQAVIPIMEMLTLTNTNIIYALLKLINLIITSNQSFLQSLCLVGLIPAIIRFAAPPQPTPSSPPSPPSSTTPLPLLRLEAANFIRQFCYTSDYTRKMFIACDGLSILIAFLSEPYPDHLGKNLIFNAIDCVRHVFDSTFQPKNDFCRLFCKFKLLPPLVRIMVEVAVDSSLATQHEFLLKISQILHLFSQGDSVVKQQFAQPRIIAPMLSLLPALPPDCLLLFLKTFCALSMDSNTLDHLEEAGAIPALLPHLAATSPPENQHQVLLSMYYLCQLKSSRQEQAALHGLIPHLQRFIQSDHPLKQFAFPIIFALCKTSKRTRAELKKCDGVLFYLQTLSDPYWRSHALEVLAVWLSEEPQRVGFLLTQPSSVNALLACVSQTVSATQFEKMLGSVRKLLLANVRVNQTLGRSYAFVHVIKSRLETESSNAIRVHLLNILSLLLVAHDDALQLASDHDLLDVLERLAGDKEGVLVASLAQKMQDRLTAEAEREQDIANATQRR